MEAEFEELEVGAPYDRADGSQSASPIVMLPVGRTGKYVITWDYFESIRIVRVKSFS